MTWHNGWFPGTLYGNSTGVSEVTLNDMNKLEKPPLRLGREWVIAFKKNMYRATISMKHLVHQY